MKVYQQIVKAKIPIFIGLIFLAVLSVILLFTMPVAGVFGLLMSLGGFAGTMFANGQIYGGWNNYHPYEITFVKQDGEGVVDLAKANYLAKNMLYLLALQNPGSRFSLMINGANDYKPVLITTFGVEQVTAMCSSGKDFHGVSIRLSEKPNLKAFSSAGSFIYCIPDDAQIKKETAIVNLADFVKKNSSDIEAIFLNMYFDPKKKDVPHGNIVFRAVDVSKAMSAIGAEFDFIKSSQRLSTHPFAKIYDVMFKTIIKMSLSESLVDAVEIVKFPPVKNFEDENMDLSHKWYVGASGERRDVPVLLRRSSLVLQNYPNVSNPASIWANYMMKTDSSRSSFLILDFDGGVSTTAKSMNKDMLLNKDIFLVKAPTDSPEHIIDMLCIWKGVSQDYFPQMLAALMVSVERFVRAVFADISRERQDKLATMLQGAILTLIDKGIDYDLTSITIALKEMPAPINFLKNAHKIMRELVYLNSANLLFQQVWGIMERLGGSIDYSKTIAAIEPSATTIADLNQLYRKLQGFVAEPGNLILSNSESHYNMPEYPHVLYDLSGWNGKAESLTLEYMLSGIQYLSTVRDFLGYPPTNILVNGLSQLPLETQQSAIRMLNSFLTHKAFTGNVIIADSKPVNGYAKMFTNRIISDLYVFRMQEVGEFDDLFRKTKIKDSVYTLSRQLGYIFRISPAEQRLIPGNIFTANPKLIVDDKGDANAQS